MVKSLLSRLSGKARQQPVETPTPDISRVMRVEPKAPKEPDTVSEPDAEIDAETIDVESWLKADLKQLSTTWTALLETPEADETRVSFEQAVHNLHGASGAYGGGPLTRLTSSLTTLLNKSQDTASDAALINLHVQACRAASMGSAKERAEIANAVCDALEVQVEIAVQ